MDRIAQRRGRARLIGIAEEGPDGHVRISSGSGYELYHGSHESHALMQEKAEAFMSALRDRGLSLEDLSREECAEVLDSVGMVLEEKVAG